MKRTYSIALLLLLCTSQLLAQPNFSLDGAWQFRRANSNEVWRSASVPGTVHTDLFANGVIAHPHIGCNHLQQGWVDTLDWEYQRAFMLPKWLKLNQPVNLVFDGLDTYADVYVNDSLILSCHNMFRSWSVNCAEHLRTGENTLRVVFKSAVKIAEQKSKEMGFRLPDSDYAYVRKAAYHFGWDWGPRLVTCGIWQSVRLHQTQSIDIDNISISTQSINPRSAAMRLNFDYASARSARYGIKVVDADAGATLLDSTFEAEPADGTFSALFNILNPQLWWPNGHGERHQYRLKVVLSRGSKLVFSKLLKIGVCTLRLVNQPDSIGESFLFEVNGRAVFAKGANVIPPHSFVPSVSDSAWIAIADDALRSNMNMVRVWGGGIYPPDVFMQACTERGIMVWQDFMFACSMYPWDREFLQNVEAEAVQQVKRLRKHTCLALWCGNNEVDEGWHNWGWKPRFDGNKPLQDSIWNGYRKLFHQVLRRVVATHDETRSYWASSPKYGWGRKESMTHGDSHYWGVWWGLEPLSRYREKIPRFMSEFGMQGAPSAQAVQLFSSSSTPDTADFLCHQKHPTGYQTIKTYMDREGFAPASLSDWIYHSQIMQAIAYKTAIEAQRLAAPRCMGTLYWQLNDCWPVVSWATIDHLGRWKAAQHTIASCYQTVIAGALVSGGSIGVKAVSDSLSPIAGVARIRVINPMGDVLVDTSHNIDLEPNVAKTIATFSMVENRIDTSNCAICIGIQTNSGRTYESVSFLGKVYNSQVDNPMISLRTESSDGGGEVVLSTKHPAYFVQLTSPNPSCSFERNFIHLLPGREYRVRYTGSAGGSVTARSVR